MEKRLFLAVFLSLVVVFGFQTIFGTKQPAVNQQQPVVAGSVKPAETPVQLPSNALPAAAALKKPAAFEEKITTIENSLYQIRLSNKGGSIDEIYLKEYEHLLPVKGLAAFNSFQDEPFTLEQAGNGKARFVYKGEDWLVTKDVSLNQDFTISMIVNIKNNSANARSLSGEITDFVVDTSRLDKTSVQSDYTLYEYSVSTAKGIVRKDNARNFNEKWNKEDVARVDWVAFRDKYFVTLVQPKDPQANYVIKPLSTAELAVGSKLAGAVVDPGAVVSFQYKIYAGPQRLDLLSKADKAFTKVMVFSNWGWLDAISKALYWLLGTLHHFIPVWGLCIIAISLIVYGLMYPLTLKSLVSMKKLQAVQPKMKELQEKYKNNPERLNKEIVELYRVHQVNPISGCLPMLLQMPIFVGLYQVLWRSIYFRGQSFLWIKDLSMPDHTLRLPFAIPFLGEYLNVLPILMVAIMGLQQQLNMKTMSTGNPEQ
ncbi:MAG: membrane protein insertase YidC, partial [Syntrophales bacterium]|nr:membrane protein insertase YidC [Syntrophales bacterium]